MKEMKNDMPEVEEFEIVYEGKRYTATRRGPMDMSVTIPEVNGIRNRISRQENGWLFLSTQEGDPYYQCNILLKDDGSLYYANEDQGYKMVSANYNPERGYGDAGLIEDTAKQLYSVAKQFEAFEKLGVSPMKVMLLRGMMYKQTLKMLGYDDPSDVGKKSPDTSISSLDFNRIAYTLENFQNMGAYLSATYDRDKTPYITTRIPEGFTREMFMDMYDENVRILGENAHAIKEDDENAKFIREEFLPDYRMDMEATLANSGLQMYPGLVDKSGRRILSRLTEEQGYTAISDMAREMAELWLDLNFDLLPYNVKANRVNAVSLVGEDLYHKIGQKTDSDEYRLATIARNRYVEGENDRYIQRIEQELRADRVRNSSIGPQLIEFINGAQADIDKCVESTKEIEKWRLYFDKERKIERSPDQLEGPEDY